MAPVVAICILSTWIPDARNSTGVIAQFTISVVRTIVVYTALNTDRLRTDHHSRRTNTASSILIEDETLGTITDASASNQDEAIFKCAADAVAVIIKIMIRRTYTIFILI
jgi:hypothetical protein